MAKSRISKIVDLVIDGIEIQLMESNKHVIRIETVKNRAMEYIEFDAKNDDTVQCVKIGFDQIVHIRLHDYGYRSVRTGMFINLDDCDNIKRLKELFDSADTSVADKQKVMMRIKKKLDGQMVMQFDEEGHCTDYIETMTEEEFVADLEADAI
ncbi:MAG: hypothetical protein IKG04_02270 [Exiguobacterium sp.]|nr:hypothetical protein [Exiguobacterium sp.]